LQNVKNPYNDMEIALSAKLPVISCPHFTLSLLDVSSVIVDVGVPGGASENFQSRVNTISLQGCGTCPGHQLPEPYQKKKMMSIN
jgi:hypothetical protein